MRKLIGLKPYHVKGYHPICDAAPIGHKSHMDVDDFIRRLQARIDADPDLTPAGLATRAGLDNSTIRGLLSGKATAPRLDTVTKVMNALDTTLEEFMADPKTPEEIDILRLLSRLPAPERMQLLGFAKALDAQVQAESRGHSQEIE